MSRRTALSWALGALVVVLGAVVVDASVASGTPAKRPRPGAAPATFQPPGFGHLSRGPDRGTGVAAPYVQAFGQQSAAPLPPRHSTRPSIVPYLDGCDHDYGTVGQCVPWSFPAGVTDRCAWLREHRFGPLRVRGVDRLRLDTNHDRIACGPGDR
jgi:hypothetical protein